MNKLEIRQILTGLGMSPGSNFGQNFLIDGNLLDFIARSANPASGEKILEIGPGLGALTRKLLDAGAKLTAIELDKRLHEYLSRAVRDEAFELIQGDACRLDLIKLMGTADFRCIANLPYSISSPFLGGLLALPQIPSGMLFLLQKETGQRLAAGHGTKEYGSLTVLVQSCYRVKYLRTVPPQVFYPQPKVESALLEFCRLEDYPGCEFRSFLRRLVRTAFSQRRKIMRKALVREFTAGAVDHAYSELKFRPDIRAEMVTVDEFNRLAEILRHYQAEAAGLDRQK